MLYVRGTKRDGTRLSSPVEPRDDRLSPAATAIVSLCGTSWYCSVRELRFASHSNKHVVNRRIIHVYRDANDTVERGALTNAIIRL